MQRNIVDRCLYGVDVNPMAAEMTKLSLWLITMQKGRPFTFVDHAIRTGDSLLGVTSRQQILDFHLEPHGEKQLLFASSLIKTALEKAREKRERLESFTVMDIRDAEEKERLLQEAEEAVQDVRTIADVLVGAALATAGKSERDFDDMRVAQAELVREAFDGDVTEQTRAKRIDKLARRAQELLDEGRPASQPPRRPMHWVLEFPEIFAGQESGFHGIVGNPPFVGGRRIRSNLGADYLNYLTNVLCTRGSGNADLCAYMFLRAAQVLCSGGGFGLLATNTIAQGDTRELGLERLAKGGCTIYRAVPSRKWPGEANLEVAHVWVKKGVWNGRYVLQETQTTGITPFLAIPGRAQGKPHRLAANAGKSFQGSIVLGMGFVLTPEQAQELIAKDPRNKEVLFPYLNGEDLNSRPDQSPSRCVINFHDWPEERARQYADCWRIIEEKVRPERQRKKPDGTYALRRPLPQRYWHYADKRPALYSTIAGMDRVLVTVNVKIVVA